MAARGVAMIVGGIVICLFPLGGMSARGGRGGKGKALVILVSMLGPFAPLLGIALGLGGALMIVFGLKRVPKAITGSVASVLFLIVLISGGIGMMPAFEQLASGSGASRSGQTSSSGSWTNMFASAKARAMLEVINQYEAAVEQTVGQNPDRIADSQVAGKFKTISSKLSQIDLSDCPDDFQRAFRKHATEWARLGSAISRVQASNSSSFSGNHSASMDQTKAQFELQHTWDRVKSIANQHGLEIREE